MEKNMERDINNQGERTSPLDQKWFEPDESLIDQPVYHPMAKNKVIEILTSVKPRKLIEDWNV